MSITREEILARYTPEEAKAFGSVSRGYRYKGFTPYDIISGDLVCPWCKHPVSNDFYHCGDSHCCGGCWYDREYTDRNGVVGYTLCDCSWAPSRLRYSKQADPTMIDKFLPLIFEEVGKDLFMPIIEFDEDDED